MALWSAGVGGLGAGTHEEDTPNPNRELWQLAAALLMETEHSPKGADSVVQGGQQGCDCGCGGRNSCSQLPVGQQGCDCGCGGRNSCSQLPVGQPLSKVRGAGL